MKKVRVVVVDDSAFNRRTISRMLEALPEIEVIGYATDGEEGIRKILELKPDLVTLDLEMPKMDGFTLLRIIMSRCPTPILVISAQTGSDRVFKALELGAVDFIAKPSSVSEELLKIQEDLHNKVRSVLDLNMDSFKHRETLFAAEHPALTRKKADHPLTFKVKEGASTIVAIGSSTGGPPALQSIFTAFTEKLPFAVLVSQHMPAGFTKTFADRLNRLSAFDIKEAQDGDLVRPGSVLIAPGGANMVLRRNKGEYVVSIVPPESDDKYVPSVDSMFLSCAEICGSGLLGVILTGMGNDGSRGVRAIKSSGGQVFAEAENTSVVFGMPREAIATGVVDKVIPLDRMAREIILRCGITPT